MAKINDSFRDDKLYFILNASDLASSERELQGVKKHVNNQLKANGVKEPKVYHLSSKRAMLAKTDTHSDLAFGRFEQQFYTRTVDELKHLGFNLLRHESERYYQTLEEGIRFFSV